MTHHTMTENTPSETDAIADMASLSPATTEIMDEHPPPRRRTFQSVAIILVDLNRALHRNAPLLRRSLTASFVVGTVLVMINQGPALLNGDLHHIVTWRVPLNYVVPFCVATWGALSNRHR